MCRSAVTRSLPTSLTPQTPKGGQRHLECMGSHHLGSTPPIPTGPTSPWAWWTRRATLPTVPNQASGLMVQGGGGPRLAGPVRGQGSTGSPGEVFRWRVGTGADDAIKGPGDQFAAWHTTSDLGEQQARGKGGPVKPSPTTPLGLTTLGSRTGPGAEVLGGAS